MSGVPDRRPGGLPSVSDLLAIVRAALGRDASTPAPPVPTIPSDLRPRLADDHADVTDLTSAFIASARRAGAEVHEAPSDLSPTAAYRVGIHPASDPTDPFALELAVAHASVAIAVSGTVLLDEGDPLALMATPTLVVHVARDRIVATLHDGLRLAAARPTPASRVFVTGPSKTADIEGILITGVHGPGRVILIIA